MVLGLFFWADFSKSAGYLFLIAWPPVRRTFETFYVKTHKFFNIISKNFEEMGCEKILSFSNFEKLPLFDIFSKTFERYVSDYFTSIMKSFTSFSKKKNSKN